ncbi:putative O-linked N-acetylglucosamine transferase (SPINDLY family) [Litoreibacter ponti]|uniref:protein O-GlcNAc transferase n=1 Tax=Litoreibacter ponti TaxID=1510457 RepID=A0A2T6BFW7_9RHOB|nr:tetratricopeptide repeat protein [Litoreibacter ponti]PTX54947.1 putative O-linked N-acetylglucosamine transferase (SPINDLY family) [Litoreibacter ponti]
MAPIFPKKTGGGPTGGDPLAGLKSLYRQRRFADVLRGAQTLPKAVRGSVPALTLIGAAQMELGQAKQAEVNFRAAVLAEPGRPAGHNNLGLALRAMGEPEKAVRSFRSAIKLRERYPEAWNGLGTALQDAGDVKGAEQAFKNAAKLRPQDPEIWTNLGNIHQAQGRNDKAIAAYQTALKRDPTHANAHYNYGLVLKASGSLQDAVDHYRAAVKAKPNFIAALNNLGNTLQALGQLAPAEDALRRAVDLAPNDAATLNNLGTVLQKMGRLDEAVAAYKKAVEADPDHAMAQAQRLHQMTHLCDWRAFDLLAETTELGCAGDEIPPLTLLAMEDAPERQLARAKTYADAVFGEGAPRPVAVASARPEKLRIGYFSADFRNHPVARLISGTLAVHDRSRFELYGYSFGPDTGDDMRAALAGEFSNFTDIRALSDAEAARRINDDKLDIAVDLTSYTQHSRSALFARRIAPVQVNYLGFPGTSGAGFMDYIVVDPMLVPPSERAHVSEALIALPHCYQPNDNRRAVPRDAGSRADHGLPEDGVVLCCFNSAYKITLREWAIWMRVLLAVDGAVLWLLESNAWAKENLRAQAIAAGVDPDRLVFAPRASNDAHLARHAHADLFLDTFAYNAHTTGSDALWMGVPVITLRGRQFAARVCASLLGAVGLDELICETEAEYEALILELAQAPDRRAALRTHLETKRLKLPLFDTEGYTRALEAGFEAAHARWRDGQAPADISI